MKKSKIILGCLVALSFCASLSSCKGQTGPTGPQGIQGVPGENGTDGVGISLIKKIKTEGLVDTYSILYTDGTSTTFTVTNGCDGIQGIQGEKGNDGHSPVITIGENGNWFIDGVDTTKKAEGLKGETGNGISKIEKTLSEDLVDTYTITFTNGETTTFTITNGSDGIQGIQGEKGNDGHSPVITIGENGNWFIDGVDTTKKANGLKGETGNGISNIEKTLSEDLVDTYTITFTNGETTTFTITNGSDGIQGIQGEKGNDGHSPVITIGENGNWFIDGIDTTKKAEGLKGETGNGISNIEKTSSEGLVDTYTITFTNGTSTTFNITNGSNGKSAYETYLDYHPEYTGTEEEWINSFIGENSHTVTFDSNGGTPVSSQIVSNQGGAVKPDDPTKEGYVFDGWYIGDTKWNFYLYSVNQDITLKAKWIENTFNIKTLATAGGSYTNINGNYQFEDSIELIATPNIGYEFVGWYDSRDNLLSNSSNYTYIVSKSDEVITAKFNLITHNVEYIVPNGTTNNNPTVVGYNDSYELINASHEGYQFAGWYLEDNYITPVYELDNLDTNLVLYGKFIPKTYTLTLNTNIKYSILFDDNYDGGALNEQFIYTGDTIIIPNNPTREGYIFAGWYLEDNSLNYFNFDEEITEDLHLYAKWEEVSEIGVIIDPSLYKSSTSAMEIVTDTTPIQYYFTSYETKAVSVYFNDSGIKGYLEIYDETTDEILLSISQNSSSSFVKNTISITKGHVYRIKVYGNTQDTNETILIYFETINRLKSTGIASGTITRSIKYGETIDYRYDSKIGFNFIGWFDENDVYYIARKYNVSYDLTLTARFEVDENNYVLSTSSNENFNNYTVINNEAMPAGSEITLEVTNEPGYEFIGWYEGNKLVSNDLVFNYIMPARNVTLVAKFELIKYYVTYVVPTGTINENDNFFTDFDTITLVNPSLKGNTFGGWYLDPEYNTAVTIIGEEKADITIYGKFITNTYTLTLKDVYYEYNVTFNLNYSGSTNIVKKVTSGNKVALPSNPTRSGYLFLGWYTNSGCTNYYNFSSAITKNITLYAKWKSTSYNIINNMYSYNSNTSVKTITTKTTYVSGSGYVYYAFTAFESGSHDIYFKPGRGAWIYLIDGTAGTTLIDYLNITNTSSYTKKTVNLTIGHYYYFKLGGSPEDRDGTDTLKIYGTGFSNIKSTGVANSTYQTTIKYGDTINFNTQIKPNTKLVGWYTLNDELYNSLTYDVDYDLVLRPRFE